MTVPCPGCGRPLQTNGYDRFLRDLREYGITAMVFEHAASPGEPAQTCVVDPLGQAGQAFIAAAAASVERN